MTDMSQSGPSQFFLKDPLSEVTRKGRRTLLGVSLIGIVMAKAGLMPTKISSLGIEFSQPDKSNLLLIISFIVTYFLLQFLIYSVSDFEIWGDNIHSALGRQEDRKLIDEMFNILQWRILLIIIIRILFEFLFPLIVGFYTICLLSSFK